MFYAVNCSMRDFNMISTSLSTLTLVIYSETSFKKMVNILENFSTFMSNKEFNIMYRKERENTVSSLLLCAHTILIIFKVWSRRV